MLTLILGVEVRGAQPTPAHLPPLANKIKKELILDTVSVKKLKARNILQVQGLISPSSCIFQSRSLRYSAKLGKVPPAKHQGKAEAERQSL